MKSTALFVCLAVSSSAFADGLNSIHIDYIDGHQETVSWCSTQVSDEDLTATCDNSISSTNAIQAPITNDSPNVKLTVMSPHFDFVPSDGFCVQTKLTQHTDAHQTISEYEVNCGDVIFRNRFDS
jgi:hypothetical protein